MTFYDIQFIEDGSYAYDLTYQQLQLLQEQGRYFTIIATHQTTYQTIFEGASLDNLAAWENIALPIGTRVHFRVIFSTATAVQQYLNGNGGPVGIVEQRIVPILNGCGITLHQPISDYAEGNSVDIYGTYTGAYTHQYSALMVEMAGGNPYLAIKFLIAIGGLALIVFSGLSLFVKIKGDADLKILTENGDQAEANQNFVQWLDTNGYADQVPYLFPKGVDPRNYETKTDWNKIFQYGLIGVAIISGLYVFNAFKPGLQARYSGGKK